MNTNPQEIVKDFESCTKEDSSFKDSEVLIFFFTSSRYFAIDIEATLEICGLIKKHRPKVFKDIKLRIINMNASIFSA